PPLRLNDETVPPSPSPTAGGSCVQMLNHHQHNYKHQQQQQQQQQRHQLFQQQRRLSSVERCPCCSNSPNQQQHIPMAAPTQVPRILVESRGTELQQQQHQDQRHFNRNRNGREEGTVAATESETAGRHTPPPLMRRF
uniref:Uncharacterized protein n=1 Tax=Globodera pallida TaxID=36090 RepID=A0A183C777_GLOPA